MTAVTQETTTKQARAAGPSRRVLIVEDELLVAWHLESLVREQNLEVCGLVPDGEGAVEQAVDLDVDLILMDVRLAGRMDGIEAARRIRDQRDTPIIFITAHGDQRHPRPYRSRVPGRAGAGQADHRPTACATAIALGIQEVVSVESFTSPPSAPARRCR